jgi:hypothetical protein
MRVKTAALGCHRLRPAHRVGRGVEFRRDRVEQRLQFVVVATGRVGARDHLELRLDRRRRDAVEQRLKVVGISGLVEFQPFRHHRAPCAW